MDEKVIGTVTTSGFPALDLPPSTYNVIAVIDNFAGTGTVAYVTDVFVEPDEHLIIVGSLAKWYTPLP